MSDKKRLWGVNLLVGDKNKQKSNREYCVGKDLLAIGWAKIKFKDFRDFKENGRETYGKSFIKTAENMETIKKGDYCWTRSDNGKYYLGIVEDDEPSLNDDSKHSEITWCRKCKWKEFDVDDVPGIIANSFRGKTIWNIYDQKSNRYNKKEKDKREKIFLYSKFLFDGKMEKLKIEDKEGFFYSMLFWYEWEDIIGIYLQEKKNYIYIPSTNKNSAPVIEYMLINRKRGNKKAVVQCKTGNSSIEKDNKIYSDYKDCDIYIFIEKCKTEDKFPKKGGNIKNITKAELLKFCLNNKNILPNRIKKFMYMAGL